ncbi:MAG: VWA domain-containing protein [Ignavibacteriae bacterium]|nr:VWA domain-containing protein [Ignavibacteriota bacterium]NOG96894.1 VWA domain-containing protein [Ignavibacteriota bacterium]
MRTQFNNNLNEAAFIKRILLLITILLFIQNGCSLDGNYDPREANPKVPAAPSPANESDNNDLLLFLDWNSQAILNFDVYFDIKNPPEKLLVENLMTSRYTVYGLDPGVTYYWRVLAKQDADTEILGEVWSFSTMPEFTLDDGTMLKSLRVSSSPPSNVNVMFECYDGNKRGITGYTIDDFNLRDDGDTVAPTDQFAQLKSKISFGYSQKIVLMIDNSANENVDFNQIKNAAAEFINSFSGSKFFKVFKFAEEVELVQDFTSDKGLVTSSINGIQPSPGKTNLYEAAIVGAGNLNDFYSDESIEQTALILITTHSDSKGERGLNEVLQQIQNKRTYLIAFGNIDDPFSVSLLGNRENYFTFEYLALVDKLNNVSNYISDIEDSFYWLVYDSPKRDFDFHTLAVTVKNNPISGTAGLIEAFYLSNDFFNAEPGLYINATSSNPAGIDTLGMFPGLTRTLTASTFGGDFLPNYTWYVAGNKIIELTLTDDNNRAKIEAVGSVGDEAELVLTDLNNGLQKILVINIE